MQQVDDVVPYTSAKANKQGVKRNIVIADATGASIIVTLWNASAEAFNAPANSIIGLKAVRVSDFNGARSCRVRCGVARTCRPEFLLTPRLCRQLQLPRWAVSPGRTLSTLNSSSIQIDPDVREAHLLRAWYDQTGQHGTFTALSEGRGGGAGGAGAGGAGGTDEFKQLVAVKDENLGSGDRVRPVL